MKSFNCRLLLSILYFSTTCSFAQKINREYNEYFILGSLNDYLGRNGDPRLNDRLDLYFRSEKPFIELLDSVLARTYPSSLYKTVKTRITNTGHTSYEIFSDSLNKHFNTYYKFLPTSSRTTEGEVIKYGVLRDGIFSNKKQKLAFLAGCYARFSVACDTAYCLSLANSTSKAKVCNELLIELKCNPYYKTISGVPVGHKVYFHPTKEVINYLSPYSYLTNASYK